MDTPERDEAVVVARTGPSRRRSRRSRAQLAADLAAAHPKERQALDWLSVPDLRVLRSADALREEFLKRKEAGDSQGLGALLYATMKFSSHPDAPDMLNCCAYNRWRSARNTSHLLQALRAFDRALGGVKPGAQKWKIAINRWSLLNFMGAPGVALRSSAWLLAEIPSDHAMYRFLCFALGRSYFMLGRYQLSAYAFERASMAFVDSPVTVRDLVYSSWSRAAARSGQSQEAERILQYITSKTSAYYLAMEAELLFQAQDWMAFLRMVKAAIHSFGPQAPWSLDRLTVAELHCQVAAVYRGLNQHDLHRKHLAVSQMLGLNSQIFDLIPSEG